MPLLLLFSTILNTKFVFFPSKSYINMTFLRLEPQNTLESLSQKILLGLL